MKKVLTILLCGLFTICVVGCEEQKTTDLNTAIDNSKVESKINGDEYVGIWKYNKDNNIINMQIKKGDNNTYSYKISYYADKDGAVTEELSGTWNFDYTSFTTRDDSANADYTISHITYDSNDKDKLSFEVALKKVNNEDKKENVIPNGIYEFEKFNEEN